MQLALGFRSEKRGPRVGGADGDEDGQLDVDVLRDLAK